jgi:glycosyltransferase involved in cell wall biosynthesis
MLSRFIHKILSKYRRIKETLLPWESKRRKIYEFFIKQLAKLLMIFGLDIYLPYLQKHKKYLSRIAKYSVPLNKPTIAFIIPSQALSGGIIVVCQHANRLIKKGYSVILIDNKLNDPYKLNWFPNLLAEVVPVQQLNNFTDIVIATHWTTAYTVKEIPSKQKLYLIQSDETRLHPPGSAMIELARKTYSFDFKYLVIAQWLKKWLQDNFGRTSYYIPNAVDTTMFYPDKPLAPKGAKLRVLLEGAINMPFKGMKEAFQVVENMDCEVWCVSSSGKPKSNWKCDRFFESMPPDKLRQIYSSCDVLLKMSKVEGFFLPPLEMMACGGTVITNKVTGYDEYIVDGYNALVVEPGDVKAAKEKLAELINNRNLLNKLISGGKETVPKWSWEKSNDILEKVINY